MIKKIILLVIFIILGVIILNFIRESLQANSLSYKYLGTTKTRDNPFGVMVGAPFGMNLETKIKIAKELGATYYRPASALFINKWQGVCDECEIAQKNGLKLILTIRNGGGHGKPSTPPTDEKEYTRVITEILDKYKPEVLVIENEENSMELFYTGTPTQYHNELALACRLSHEKNIKCTNGGLVSTLVIALVYSDLLENVNKDEANKFLKMSLTPEKLKEYEKQQSKIEIQIERGKDLLAGYKENGADYVNFHWYSDSPEALELAKSYLENITGLPAISNEMGQQKNINPDQVTDIMKKIIDLNIPIAVWYSIDTLAYGEAKGLTDSNGTLRENGIAFQRFLKNNFALEN